MSEAWVHALLDKKQLVWEKDVKGPLLRVPAVEEHHKGEFLGELVVLRLGAIIACVGNYLVQEEDGNLRVVTEKRFLKDVSVLCCHSFLERT